MWKKTKSKKPSQYFNLGWYPTMVLSNYQLSTSAKLVFGVVSSLSKLRGYAFASNEFIAKKIGLAEEDVADSIGELRLMNFILIIETAGSARQIQVHPDLFRKQNSDTDQ